MNEARVSIKGVCQALLHNGQTANPLNKYARQLKAIPKGKNATDEDIERMAKTEFMASWYMNPKGEYILPAHNIEAMMLEGAKKHKNGPKIKAGAFVSEDPLLVFDGSEKTLEELWDGGEHALMVGVRVGRSRVMRTRAMIPAGWTANIAVLYDPGIVEAVAIHQAMEVAGLERGGLDWRPKYGRFVVVDFVVLN